VLNDNDQDVRGGVGEVIVSRPCVMRGYSKPPEQLIQFAGEGKGVVRVRQCFGVGGLSRAVT
jgi:hypothetical protein